MSLADSAYVNAPDIDTEPKYRVQSVTYGAGHTTHTPEVKLPGRGWSPIGRTSAATFEGAAAMIEAFKRERLAATVVRTFYTEVK